MKDREFSPNENRYLAEPPRLTVDNILSGKFQDGLENYLRDQICFRDGWITVKTGIQKACKDTDIGGAYVGKDGYDFEKITPEDVDEKQIARNVKAVQDFFAKASENVEKDRISFLLVPSSGLVMADKLPAHARLFDQAKYIDQIEKQMKDCRVTDVRENCFPIMRIISITKRIITGRVRALTLPMKHGVTVPGWRARRWLI